MFKFYYADTLVSPIPTISINQNNIYTNDTIIGYNYTVNINGFILSQTNNPSNSGLGISEILPGINLIQNTFSKNGNNLLITKDDITDVLLLKGGILKDINFPQTANNWATYAEYSATLEFNELIIQNEGISCSSGQIDNNTISSILIDINKYKVEQFTDGWTFAIEDDSYNYNKDFDIYNTTIAATYTINATGRTYFDNDKELLPGWVQAKNFCQYRLYNQIKNLIPPISGNTASLPRDADESCDASNTLSSMFSGSISDSLIKDIGNDYKIYNETIDCQLSESDGSFTLTYNSRLKRNNDGNLSSSDTIHTFTKQINHSMEGSKEITTVSVNGTIEGLCEGGLVYKTGNFSLPDKGSLIIGPLYKSKFTSANNLLTKVLNTNQEDLSDVFKNKLELSSIISIIVPLCNIGNGSAGIKPSSFNLTKNYMDGTITYSAEYTSDRNCSLEDDQNKTITKSTIDIEAPVNIIAEFSIPGGNFVLQDLNTKTARKITINSEGRYDKNCCFNIIAPLTLQNIIQNPTTLLPNNANFPINPTHIPTNKSFTYNPKDGSYTMTLSYICPPDCKV
jgi:hypothetical protein